MPTSAAAAFPCVDSRGIVARPAAAPSVDAVISAVLFDFGGVVTTSPFDNFNELEAELAIPADTIRGINATNGDTNAWAQYERSAVDADEFCSLFEAEARAVGFEIPGRRVLDCVKTEVRPFMVEALRRVHDSFKTAMLTNNFTAGDSHGSDTHAVAKQYFDVIIESAVVGVRKPTPRFYELACEALEVEPAACVFLDDLGINLKPARAMGMTTIKVVDPRVALAELGAATGLDFSDL